MKLRNKKTGEIVDDVQYRNYSFSDGFGLRTKEKDYNYKTLAEFVEDWEDWEDYKPAEPLIKDEKIRKAVRAWADANYLKWACYSLDGRFYDKTTDHEITFKFYSNRSDIPECKLLTIAELCGEE